MPTSAAQSFILVSGLISALAFASETPIQRTFRAEPGGEGGQVQYEVAGLAGVTQVVVGDRFGCALSKGTVHCWGQNGRGQLGRGFADPRYRRPEFHGSAPVKLSGPVVRLAASANQICAELVDGQNACWGDFGDAFFLGKEKPESPAVATPKVFPGFEGKVTLHPNWGCAVSKGEVACRGRLPWSGTSFDSRLPRITPVQIKAVSDVQELVMLDRDFALARTPAGLWWLGGVSPQFLGEKLKTVTKVPTIGLIAETEKVTGWIGGPCFVDSSERVRCIEHGSNPVEGLTDVKQYVSGELFGCELRTSGRVTCHGRSQHGALGPNAEGYAFDPVDVGRSDVRELVSTRRTVCALNGKGQVHCWGAGFGNSPKRLWSNAASLAGGEEHLCMIGTAGDVRCLYGVTEVREPRPATAVAARFLDEERFVVGWKSYYAWADVWSAKKKSPEARLDLCSAPLGFTLSADGKWLAGSACPPGMLNDAHVLDVWSTADWRKPEAFPMWGSACVPGGTRFSDPTPIAFASGRDRTVWYEGVPDVPGKELDRALCLFDFGKKELVKTLPIGTTAGSIHSAKEGDRLVLQSARGLVVLKESDELEWARSCVVNASTGEVLSWVPARALVSHQGDWFLLRGERFATSDPKSPVWSEASERDECKKPTVVISDDDSRILYSCEEGRIQLLDAATGAVLATIERSGLVAPLAISPAGTTALLSGSNDDVFVWNVGVGSVKRLRAAKGPAGVPD